MQESRNACQYAAFVASSSSRKQKRNHAYTGNQHQNSWSSRSRWIRCEIGDLGRHVTDLSWRPDSSVSDGSGAVALLTKLLMFPSWKRFQCTQGVGALGRYRAKRLNNKWTWFCLLDIDDWKKGSLNDDDRTPRRWQFQPDVHLILEHR